MRGNLRFTLLIFALIPYSYSIAQFNLKRQIPEKKKFEASQVIDSTYGIQIYERLNMNLSGDSVRMCGNYACQNWVEDIYTTGELLHKGFYIDGQVKTYKNYYPNGNLEREFKAVDNFRSSAKLYFPSGNIKSEIKYNEGEVQSWVDYNEAGVVVLNEEMDRSMEYYLHKKEFYDNGQPKRVMELTDKKKKLYDYKEYYEDGTLKVEGKKVYSEGFFDYVFEGKFKYYKKDGSLDHEETYSKGVIEK